MARNFLRDFASLAKGTEVPDIFMLWCGVAGLSFSLGRSVWLDMGHYTIYPNLYIVLIASSGRHRKSTAIGIIERLLRRLEPKINIIAQKISPEALIEALHVVHTENEKTLLRETCEGCVIADELSTFLDKRSYEIGLGSLLITLFDCKEVFEYRTKARGQEILPNTCLGLLSASTLDWVRQAIPIAAVGEGLTSRICFVYSDTPPLPVARTQPSKENALLQDQLLVRLMEVSQLKGEFRLSDVSWKLYEDTYNTFFTKSRFYEDPLMSGYASRRHVHLLKLGMMFSVAETNEMVVEESHLRRALILLEQSELDMQHVVRLIASTDQGLITDIIIRTLRGKQALSRNALLKSIAHRISSRELTEIMETLIHSGQVTCEARAGKIYYCLTGQE